MPKKFIVIKTPQKIKKPKIIGLMILRNEALILKDSLDAMGKIVDGIIVLDDASTDNSVDICLKHPKVLNVVLNTDWVSGLKGERYVQESIHRQKILEIGRRYRPTWFLYLDADERVDGAVREYLLSNSKNKTIAGVSLRLYDAYMTKRDQTAYKNGSLYNFRQNFGPEYREIIMIWKNSRKVFFKTDEMSREPSGIPEKDVAKRFLVQHYGKAISQEQWENTCDFYIKYFPIYAEKWAARKGKSIHTKSDFGAKLMTWEEIKAHGGTKLI